MGTAERRYEIITVQNIILFALMGGIVGELLSLFVLTIKQAYKKDTVISYYDDGSPAKFFITGDKHRHFDRVKEFCREMNTRRKDVLIILGDSGFNYYDDKRDDELKKEISALNITLFCLHGNKENRPQNVGTYGIRSFCGGKVYYEPKYPNIYFAIDGEIYTFEGKKYMVVGGAHSVDKMRCLEEGTPFWYGFTKVSKKSFVSSQCLNAFRNLGLALFFVGTGFSTGTQDVSFDIRAILYGILITLTAIICGCGLCKLIQRKYPLQQEFIIAGGMTSSPAYGALSGITTEASVNCFSFSYFGALVTLIIAIQITI